MTIQNNKKSNITFVTALYDIGRGNLDDGFKRSFDHYLECFSRLLELDINLVIFCDSKVNDFVWKYRNSENTRTVVRPVESLKTSFPMFDRVQEIRKDPKWYNQAGWLADSTQAKLEYYNPIVMSKQFMLNDATLFNHFDTKYYLWIDAGLNNTVQLSSYFDKEHTFEKKLEPYLDKMLYLCFPYDGTCEVHGFEKEAMNRYAGVNTEWVARGGLFGGKRDSINDMNNEYYWLLNDTLNNGYMGTEESIFTLLTYKYPHKCNIQPIDSNGLVYKFFEQVKSDELKIIKAEELAIYCLTYNLPKQFELFVQSFKTAYPKDFDKIKKYVINNSTIDSVSEEYKKLFTENDFTEFKFNNIGINDGRHFAAEHFYESDHEYMIFFEDDMLLHENNNTRCKMGFTTYQDNLFDKCIEIIKEEKLDYLKLAFSEFYGDSHVDWAWFNVPKDKKDLYYEMKSDGTHNSKTKIYHTGSYKGLPYSVGHYHYCNWPILFTKSGTKKIFLDEVYAHKYEQTWMSLTKTLHVENKIKAGCLLATAINHYRKYHYDGKTRKENQYSGK